MTMEDKSVLPKYLEDSLKLEQGILNSAYRITLDSTMIETIRIDQVVV